MGVGITGAPAWMAPGGRKPVSDGKWDWGLWAMRKVKGDKAWGHKNVVTSLTIPPHKPRKLRVKPRKNPQEKVGIETYPPPTPTILAMGGTGRTPPHTHTHNLAWEFLSKGLYSWELGQECGLNPSKLVDSASYSVVLKHLEKANVYPY